MPDSQLLVQRLLKLRELTVRVSGDTIGAVPAATGGFTVTLVESRREWIVGFDGWHEHFSSEEEAIHCFAFGLSEDCRLKVEYRGPMACRWSVEARTENGWREDSTVGLLLFPFWRKARTEYRQNAILPGNGGDFLK